MAEGDLLQAQIKAYVALDLVQVAKRTPTGRGQDYLNALIEEVRRASDAVEQLESRDQREPH
jgi:hypothetical protein